MYIAQLARVAQVTVVNEELSQNMVPLVGMSD